MGDYPLEPLNKNVLKYGVKPTYEITHMNITKNSTKFIGRLTCPITNKGPSLTVEGSASSKKEAKRDAARLFIYKYLTIGKDDSDFPPHEFVTLTNNIPISDRIIVLEIICSTIIFAKPNYEKIAAHGTFQSPCFVIECRVSYLRSGGKGESRTAAETDAATKMIQLLMDVESIHHIIKAQYSSTEKTADDAQAITSEKCSGDSPVAPICKEENTVNIYKPPEPKTNLSSRLIRLRSTTVSVSPVMIRKKPLSSINTEHSETSNGKSADKQSIGKTSCTLSNGTTSNNVDATVSGTKTNEICRSLTRLQLNSRIERIDKIVEGYEKQLYDMILEVLMCGSQSLHKSVSILSHDYDIVLNRFSPPKISQGSRECDDKSIRIACLMQTLIECKGYKIEYH